MIRYPAERSERDRFVLELRGRRPVHDPWRHQGLLVEEERTEAGGRVHSATVFLTGRECPWRCVMCDLWRHTTSEDTPRGAIPAQIAAARSELSRMGGPAAQMKLYNAGSFFDPRAVPPDDYEAIAAELNGLSHVVVECHPALVRDGGIDRFLETLERHRTAAAPLQLEVAIGLETAHPGALDSLNKRMTVADYTRACGYLLGRRVRVRTFILLGPPFVPADEQREWLFRSIEAAIAAGSTVISLIPTRADNGAMTQVAASGQFTPIRFAAIEDVVDAAVARYAAQARVFVDLWELRRFADCDVCLDARVARLQASNLEQRVGPRCPCIACQATHV